MKRIFVLISALVLMLCLCSCGEATNYPDITEAVYINDYADLLSEVSEREILDLGKNLFTKTPARVVIATVATTGGESIKSYTKALSNLWGFGSERSDESVLVVISAENGDFHIEAGKALKKQALSNSNIKKMNKYFKNEYISQGQTALCVSAMYRTIVNEIYMQYGFSVSDSYTPISEYNPGMSVWAIIGIVAAGIVFLAVIFVILRMGQISNTKKRRARHSAR